MQHTLAFARQFQYCPNQPNLPRQLKITKFFQCFLYFVMRLVGKNSNSKEAKVERRHQHKASCSIKAQKMANLKLQRESLFSTIFGSWKKMVSRKICASGYCIANFHFYELYYVTIPLVQILLISLKIRTSGNHNSGNHIVRSTGISRLTRFQSTRSSI